MLYTGISACNSLMSRPEEKKTDAITEFWSFLCLGSKQNVVPRTYGVNFKHEEQIVFSRIFASFAFDPPHMKPGKVVAAETTPGELCKVRVL